MSPDQLGENTMGGKMKNLWTGHVLVSAYFITNFLLEDVILWTSPSLSPAGCQGGDSRPQPDTSCSHGGCHFNLVALVKAEQRVWLREGVYIEQQKSRLHLESFGKWEVEFSVEAEDSEPRWRGAAQQFQSWSHFIHEEKKRKERNP